MKERHRRVERAGWSLAPDVKEDVGGMRDVHALTWISNLVDVPVPQELKDPYDVLLAVREALHATAERKLDRIRIDLQEQVAKKLGLEGDEAPDVLMAKVHSAARAIENTVAIAVVDAVERALGGPRRSGETRVVNGSARIDDGLLTHLPGLPPNLRHGLDLLHARSLTGRAITHSTFEWLRHAVGSGAADRWTDDMRTTFNAILAGEHAPSALELLEHAGGWPGLMPEWSAIRGRAQYDPYHRYTVDGHLFLAVAEVGIAIQTDPVARRAAEEAGSLDTLRVGTLLHDVGKGSGEDHSVAGERMARAAATRMGFALEEITEVASLVRLHLLLVDTATRRDLDDGAVIAEVAEVIGDSRLLRLLYILSVADGRATGPEGWSAWKAALVGELYRKVLVALETGELPARSDIAMKVKEVEAFEPSLAGRVSDILNALPPSYLQTPIPDMVDEIRLLVNPPGLGQVRHRVDQGVEQDQAVVTVCVSDRPGTLARTAGVLSLHRLSVLRANAYATTTGLALERFIVRRSDRVDWEKVAADLEAAYAGGLALEAHLGRKIADYHPTGVALDPKVTVLHDESGHSTVVEVRCSHDALGLLYAIAGAMSDLDLDIHVAKIDTLGQRVVDVFYVRTPWGSKLTDAQSAEVIRAIEHRINRLFT
jgi:[protein-PII] uridylyltransferase